MSGEMDQALPILFQCAIDGYKSGRKQKGQRLTDAMLEEMKKEGGENTPHPEHWESELAIIREKNWKVTVLGRRGPPCALPIHELSDVTISNLKIETSHKGRRLVGKITKGGVRVVGIQFYVSDQMQDCIEVSLFNTFINRPFEHIIKPGMFVIVKHPYVKLAAEDRVATVRVDHPNDIVFVDQSNEIVQNAFDIQPSHEDIDYRVAGNELFKKGEFDGAMVAYTKGLARDPANLTLKLNRAAVKLALNQFDGAKKDCEDVLAIDDKNVKGLARLGKAHYGLREFEEARSVAEKLCELDRSSHMSFLQQCIERVNETKGIFDFFKIYGALKANPYTLIDVADFVGPVEVRDAGRKGRGVFLTEDVKRGQLLVVAKALEITGGDQIPNSLLDVLSEVGLNNNTMNLSELIIQRLFDNPSLAPAFFDLRARPKDYGDKNVPLKPGDPIDSFRVISIVKDNARKLQFKSSSLFLLPSYFNHSCEPNCAHIHSGCLTIIRALQDMPKDTELTRDYLTEHLEFPKRCEGLHFECDCGLCDFDRKKSQVKSRQRIRALDQWGKTVVKPSDGMSLLEACYRETSPVLEHLLLSHANEGRTDQWPEMGAILFKMGVWCATLYKRDEALSCFISCFTKCRLWPGIRIEMLPTFAGIISAYRACGPAERPKLREAGEEAFLALLRDIKIELVTQSWQELEDQCKVSAIVFNLKDLRNMQKSFESL